MQYDVKDHDGTSYVIHADTYIAGKDSNGDPNATFRSNHRDIAFFAKPRMVVEVQDGYHSTEANLRDTSVDMRYEAMGDHKASDYFVSPTTYRHPTEANVFSPQNPWAELLAPEDPNR